MSTTVDEPDGRELPRPFEAGFPAVPGHEVLKRLGQGGMGVVYKARHLELKRLVALKMIRAGADASPAELARFRAEAEAAARLQHPNIVQVYEVGEYQGQPYFTQEYIDGGSLKERLSDRPLTPREAAALVETLARAAHHAHQAGIIHRDLKPANVLLRRQSELPTVADFGLAKSLAEDSGQTRTGAVLGTPSYMAPEQALGQKSAVSPLVDVYALGAILYECLTGRPPFRAATVLETLDQVRTRSPVAPRQLQPGVPVDLDTICLKCLEKSPTRRYVTALALAEDLQRFLADQPVQARPTPAWERVLKWSRRHPAAAVLGPLLAVLLVAAAIVGVRQYRATADALQTSRTSLYFHSVGLARSQIAAGRVERGREILAECPEDLRGWEWHYLQRLCHSHLRRQQIPTQGGHAALSPTGGLVANVEGDQIVVQRPFNGEIVARLSWPFAGGNVIEKPIYEVQFGPEGRTLTARRVNGVRVWSLPDGQEVGTVRLTMAQPSAVRGDGRRVALSPFILDTATGKPIVTLQTPDPGEGGRREWLYMRLVYSPDGQYLASLAVDRVDLFDAETGRLLASLPTPLPQTLVFSPDSQTLAFGVPHSQGAVIEVWRLDNLGEPALRLRRLDVTCPPAISPDGKRLAALGDDQTIRLFDVATGEPRLTLPGHGRELTALAFSSDGTRLITLSQGWEVKEWDVTRNPEWRTLAPGQRVAAFSADGKWLASEGAGAIEVHDVDSGRKVKVFATEGTTRTLAFSPDARRLLAVTLATAPGKNDPGRDATLHVWELASGQRPLEQVLPGFTGETAEVCWAPDGNRLAWGVRDLKVSTATDVTIWDIDSAGPLATFRVNHILMGRSLVFSPDSGRLAIAGYAPLSARLSVHELPSGRTLFEGVGDLRPFSCVGFSSDGRLVHAGTVGGGGRLWNATTGQAVDIEPAQAGVLMLPSGRYLSTTSGQAELNLHDAESGETLARFRGYDHNDDAPPAVSPDGRRLATVGRDVRLWDIATGKEVLAFARPDDVPHGSRIEFSQDGTRLTYGTTVWDAAPVEGEETLPQSVGASDLDRKRFWTSILLLVLGAVPVFYLVRLYSLALLAMLHRRSGYLVTSMGLGIARPLLMGNLRGIKVALARTNPLRPFLSAFPTALFGSRRQAVLIATAHLALLVLSTAGCYLLWRHVNLAWEFSFLASAALVWQTLLALGPFAGGLTRTSPLQSIRQLRSLRGIWKWIGDGPGLYLHTMDAAAIWVALGNAEEAERLCAEAEGLHVEHTTFTQAYGALRRGTVNTARGQFDEAETALRLAEMSFGVLGHDAGLALVTLERANLLRARGQPRQADSLLAALATHPVTESIPEFRAQWLAARLRVQRELDQSTEAAALTAEIEKAHARRPMPVLALAVLNGPQRRDLAVELYAELQDEGDRALFRQSQRRQLSDPEMEWAFDVVEERQKAAALAREGRRRFFWTLTLYLIVMNLVVAGAAFFLLPIKFRLSVALMAMAGAYEQLALWTLAWLLGVSVILTIPFVALWFLIRLVRASPAATPYSTSRDEEPLKPQPRPVAPPPMPQRSGWLLWAAIFVVSLVFVVFSPQTQEWGWVREWLIEGLLLGLAFTPLMTVLALIEQMGILLLSPGSNFRVTSLTIGTGSLRWRTRCRGVIVAVCRGWPWFVAGHSYTPDYMAHPRRWLWLIGGLMTMHLLMLAGSVALWWFVTWGTLIWLWLIVFNVLCLTNHILNVRKVIRHGSPVQTVATRLAQHVASVERLRVAQDVRSLSAYLTNSASLWLSLDNPAEAERLCTEAVNLPLEGEPDGEFLRACAELTHACVERDQGHFDEAERRLTQVRQTFTMLGHETGLFVVDWQTAMLTLARGRAEEACAQLDALADHRLLRDRPLTRLELLADRLRAEAALTDATQLSARLGAYEAVRRLHPGDSFDLRVWPALARHHVRRQDSAAAMAAWRRTLATLDRLDAQFKIHPHLDQRYREGVALLRAEAEMSLARSGESEERLEVVEAVPRRWNFLLAGWLLMGMNGVLAVFLLLNGAFDSAARPYAGNAPLLQAQVERERKELGFGAATRPATRMFMGGLLLLSLAPALAWGLGALLLGLALPEVRWRGGRPLLLLGLLPWLIFIGHLSNLFPSPQPPPGGTTPMQTPSEFDEDE